MRSRFFLGFFLFILTFTIHADQLIIEPDAGRKPILDAIANTQHSLDLIMYGFTDQTLLNAILRKKQEGKNIKLILEPRPYKSAGENNKTISVLNTNDILWQGEIPGTNLIHQKTLLLDNEKAIVMTFNFTHSTFSKERNFALILDDPSRVKAIASLFSSDYNHVPNDISSTDLIISPENSRAKLLALIDHANISIRIYAQGINDYKILGALANAAKRSVNVEIITSNVLREKQQHYLERAGVKIHYSKKWIIHAKIMIIDNEKAVIGSINLTRPSLDHNRELSVITTDKQVITQLNQTFEKDSQDEFAEGFALHAFNMSFRISPRQFAFGWRN